MYTGSEKIMTDMFLMMPSTDVSKMHNTIVAYR